MQRPKFFKTKNARRALGLLLILLLAVGGAGLYQMSHQTAQATTIAKEEQVSRGDIVEGLSEEGTASVATVSTQLDVDVTIDDTKVDLDVIIDDVFVRAGENVEEGQPLFSIERSSLNTVLNTLNNEYQQAVLKLDQAQLDQQKKGTEAQASRSIHAALSQTADSTYQSSVKKIENQLAQYEQNVKDNEEDLAYYTKLYNSYDERTANLATFKRLMESGKDNYEAVQELFDDYQEDNGDVISSYNNAEKTTDSLADELENARNELSYLAGHENDPEYSEAITKAQNTYSSLASQFNDAIEIINTYSSAVDKYYDLEDRLEKSQKAYEEATETYNDYNDEYKEMYGSMGKTDLARKVSQLQIDLQQSQLDLEEYQLSYDTLLQEAENQRLTDLTTSQTADLTYQSTLTELELNVLTAQNKVDKLSAAIQKMNALLSGETIVAPCSGLVTSVDFAAGDEVDLLEAAITIAKPDELAITLTLDQEDIGEAYLDQEARVTFDAFDDQVFIGSVDAISISPARAGAPTVTYSVTVSLTGEGLESIYDGMSCEVILVTDQATDVLKVSKRAVTTQDGQATVKLKNADGTTTITPVETGFTDGSEIEIVSGLSEGDTVLIESTLAGGSANSASRTSGSAPAGGAPSAGGAMPSGAPAGGEPK